MTRDVVTVPADLPLRDVAERLAAHRISGAPVVDADGNIVGVVSETDLLKQAQSHVALPRLTLHRFGFEALPPQLLEKVYADGLSLKAGDVMSQPVVCAAEDTPLEALADLMVTHHINRLPVLHGRKPVGIVTRENILSAISQMLAAPGQDPAANQRG